MKLALAIITTTSLFGTAVVASTACSWKGCEGKPIRVRIACMAACSSSHSSSSSASGSKENKAAADSSSKTDRYNNPCGGNFATEPASNHPFPDTLPHGCQYQRSERARKTAAV
ncbi:hypothetical protein CP532_0452 [Ophiocordyceps camponoti-leonardi (nom. inval.)]|nr:hypothetical protein CP532_0452 [Ophiocordyceps camponoti-leonardi (nom. inval.)]